MLRQLLRLDFPLQRQVAVVEGEHEYLAAGAAEAEP
jgi:hypothetical protein